MSSFIGHGLAAWTIGIASSRAAGERFARFSPIWIGWLVAIALAPDLDNFLPFLHPSNHQNLRMTHSILGVQVLPVLTAIFLRAIGLCGFRWLYFSAQAIAAGFSQVLLDLLVGVTPLPLFWPISVQTFQLPFGVLPSAGKLDLTNEYLYLNLLIEMGVLAPLSYAIVRFSAPRKRSRIDAIVLILMLLVSARFMFWAYGLSR